MKNKNNTAREIWNAISKSKKPIICIDSRFDYDGLCSALAMKYIINRDLKKEINLTYANEFPDYVKDFCDIKRIQQKLDPSEINFTKYDLLIYLDSGNPGHISEKVGFEKPNNIKTIAIDHHAGNEFYGDLNYIYYIGSTCAVLMKMFKELNLGIDQELARLLAMGMIADTNCFQYYGSAEIFQYMSELMQFDFDYDKFVWENIQSRFYDDVLLQKIVYKNLKIDFEKKYAYSTISYKTIEKQKIDMKKTSVRDIDTVQPIKGLDFMFMVREEKDRFSVSFRSHSRNFNVLPIIKKLGGGGHYRAGGADLIDVKSMDEAVEKVLSIIGR